MKSQSPCSFMVTTLLATMMLIATSNLSSHSSVLAFSPQNPIHSNGRSTLDSSIQHESIENNKKTNFCGAESDSRRVRCARTRGGIHSSTSHSRGLPLSASSSSEGSGPAKKKSKTKAKKKRKTKAKAKSKTKAKTKTKAKAKRKTETAVVAETEATTDAVSVEKAEIATKAENGPKETSTDGIYYGPQPKLPDAFQFDLTGGRPGTIIESEIELEEKEGIMKEVEINDKSATGRKTYPQWLKNDYGFLQEDEDAEYDNDDPNAIDGSTLGQYDITDLNTKFDYEWNPETDDDPNLLETQMRDDTIPSANFVLETEKDEEGIEVGFDSLFGVSNPIDERTKIGTLDSYMVDVNTRDEKMLTPEFFPDDPEKAYNEDIVQYRKSMDIIETYQDEFLPKDMPVPRNVAKWYGYPEPLSLPPKNYTNNRFTKPEDLTNFDEMTPHRARERAVELARSNNAEWMPDGVSQSWHQEQRRPYEEQETLIGTLRKGHCDPDTLEMIKTALQVLGSSAELLSIEGEENTVFRFHYHGLMKNKYGMSCWTETLLRDCGVDVTGVVFETGFRARDPAYDGGFAYHGWE
eukprot:CAMPEP_0197183370 /NCGR_PEP_ID=MMETSP1423-20130617/7781_1 /TAXON_ID=476441 /ORGANISM="Pseudo-nitzschia heimii, Strain UNC1101" /LENGTH=577 /DNA_ID=CAMNT_0042633947 /DNA_START=168 /DNA_END=1901 /DNA_ORIENTATION=+